MGLAWGTIGALVGLGAFCATGPLAGAVVAGVVITGTAGAVIGGVIGLLLPDPDHGGGNSPGLFSGPQPR
jgi:hypothetical protein